MKHPFINPGEPTNARQALGAAIKNYRELRNRTHREVANRTRAAIADVEGWERGTLVPNGDQWKALREGVNRALNAYTELYHKAKAEDAAERERITRSISMHSDNKPNGAPAPARATSNPGPALTSKPFSSLAKELPALEQPPPGAPDARTVNPGQAVTYHEPPPVTKPISPSTATAMLGLAPRGFASDGRLLSPPRPQNSMAREAITERLAFARGLLLQRPNIRTNGADGLIEAIRKRFGVGVDPDAISKMRKEIERDEIERNVRSKIEREAAPVAHQVLTQEQGPDYAKAREALAPAPAPSPPPTGDVDEGNITAGVALILESIPNLMQFSITVDDNGHAQVDYQVREVKITTRGGSLTVRR